MLHTKTQTPLVQFVCGFVANLFVKHVDNKSSQWSLTVHICADNRQSPGEMNTLIVQLSHPAQRNMVDRA